MLRQDAGWSNPKVLTIFALIFLCGIAVGSFFTRSFLHHRMPAVTNSITIEAARSYGLEHLRATLNLTPEQEATITRVLDDYGKYYQNIEDEREDVAEHGCRRILDVLTPEQRKQFNARFGHPASPQPALATH
ncbi:MAG: hypothetical protein JOY54_14280 [Acidobacteriaceae bacterium]|nr:hypothetical protein [Acidobacteriaceae bacterium]